jgi:hypothetical protein
LAAGPEEEREQLQLLEAFTRQTNIKIGSIKRRKTADTHMAR